MTKGKYGIELWFYALLAFVLVALGQTLLCALLLGFVIVAENNEWLTKQVIQAFSLSLIASVLKDVIYAIGNTLTNAIDSIFRYELNVLSNVVDFIFEAMSGIITILVLVLVVMAILKVVKEKDANIPGLSAFANKVFGAASKKADEQAPQQ